MPDSAPRSLLRQNERLIGLREKSLIPPAENPRHRAVHAQAAQTAQPCVPISSETTVPWKLLSKGRRIDPGKCQNRLQTLPRWYPPPKTNGHSGVVGALRRSSGSYSRQRLARSEASLERYCDERVFTAPCCTNGVSSSKNMEKPGFPRNQWGVRVSKENESLRDYSEIMPGLSVSSSSPELSLSFKKKRTNYWGSRYRRKARHSPSLDRIDPDTRSDHPDQHSMSDTECCTGHSVPSPQPEAAIEFARKTTKPEETIRPGTHQNRRRDAQRSIHRPNATTGLCRIARRRRVYGICTNDLSCAKRGRRNEGA